MSVTSNLIDPSGKFLPEGEYPRNVAQSPQNFWPQKPHSHPAEQEGLPGPCIWAVGENYSGKVPAAQMLKMFKFPLLSVY